MKKHHVDIMISEADVRSRIAELGAEITHLLSGFYVVHLCSWPILCVN